MYCSGVYQEDTTEETSSVVRGTTTTTTSSTARTDYPWQYSSTTLHCTALFPVRCVFAVSLAPRCALPMCSCPWYEKSEMCRNAPVGRGMKRAPLFLPLRFRLACFDDCRRSAIAVYGCNIHGERIRLPPLVALCAALPLAPWSTRYSTVFTTTVRRTPQRRFEYSSIFDCTSAASRAFADGHA